MLSQAKESGQIDYDSEDSSWTPNELQTWEDEGLQQDRESEKASTSGRENSLLPVSDARLLRKADAGELTNEDRLELSRVAGFSLPPTPAPEPRVQMPIMWYGLGQSALSSKLSS